MKWMGDSRVDTHIHTHTQRERERGERLTWCWPHTRDILPAARLTKLPRVLIVTVGVQRAGIGRPIREEQLTRRAVPVLIHCDLWVTDRQPRHRITVRSR